MDNAEIVMYGAPWCPDCKRAKQLLNEQRIPYTWHDIDEDEAARHYLEQVNDGKQIIPTIVFPDGSILVEPSNAELAAKLGIRAQAQRSYYDLIVLGGGPAGMAASIYAAREGLEVLVIDRGALGGQAAVTREIENYPGFPEPLSGGELAARLKEQAERFGVELVTAQVVTGLTRELNSLAVRTKSGDEYCASAVVLAVGSTYKRLGVPKEADFLGAGVHFCATCDGPFYKGKDVIAVGGGNSAFQEALFLTKFAKSVTIVTAGSQVRASKALQEKVAEHEDIEVLVETSVKEFRGRGKLSSVVLRNESTGQTRETPVEGVFVFIGLTPNTDVFKGTVELDAGGFVVTGPNLETSVPGVFAAGDCRAGSTKQIASAVGEGATAALMVREYLQKRGEATSLPLEVMS